MVRWFGLAADGTGKEYWLKDNGEIARLLADSRARLPVYLSSRILCMKTRRLTSSVLCIRHVFLVSENAGIHAIDTTVQYSVPR
jgi:hypothetical protein